MENLKRLVPAILGAALVAHSCSAQGLPNAPSRVLDTTTRVMVVADFTLRTLDTISTHQLMADPCKCFREMDPISPSTANYAALGAFQYGIASAIGVGGRLLTKRGHPRWVKALITIDLVSEIWAVQNNERLRETR